MINSFKSYLVEEEKTLYFVWGRMNPPTAGHEKLLDFLKQKAGNNPFRIYLTQSEDDKKNPIPFVQKVKFARKGFPQYARQIMLDKSASTLLNLMTNFYKEGFKKVVICAGSDRIREYDILLNKYNGVKSKHGFYNFENISVLNAGNRDPDSKGVEGVSGTKLRGFAENGDFTTFAQYMPKKLSTADTKAVYNAVRKGIGLKEQSNFKNHIQLEPVSEIRESYMRDNLFSVGEEVVIKENGIVATIEYLGANYLIVESKGERWRKWLDGVDKVNPDDMRRDSYVNAPYQAPGYEDLMVEKKVYHSGLSKSTQAKRKAQFNKQAKMDDDDPAAYKPAPGDATAKTKISKHTKKFKDMFGDD